MVSKSLSLVSSVLPRSRVPLALLASASIQLLFASSSQALTLGFGCITNNDPTNCAIGEAQLSVEVIDLGSQVQFDFMNSGAIDSSIADVYFDDGTLAGIATLIDADDGIGGDPGVDFSEGASPSNLPAGASIPYPARWHDGVGWMGATGEAPTRPLSSQEVPVP